MTIQNKYKHLYHWTWSEDSAYTPVHTEALKRLRKEEEQHPVTVQGRKREAEKPAFDQLKEMEEKEWRRWRSAAAAAAATHGPNFTVADGRRRAGGCGGRNRPAIWRH